MTTATAPAKLPAHVAFIMDGNGRWAQKRGLSRLKGHAEGVETVRRMTEALIELGVKYGTFYAFSTENWQRPFEEVSGLFTLMRTYFKRELKTIVAKGIRVRFVGDRTPGKLADDIIDLMTEVEQASAHNTTFTLTFAINYSGRDELRRAVQTLAEQAVAGTLSPTDITAETIGSTLDTAGMPDPDLVIRTSGEQRLSNFLLWQLAYAEMYFSQIAWPDFTAENLREALASYGNRERRFGGLPATHVA